MHDDDRDPRLAAQLAVEPLDDLMRRGLVHRAIDAAGTEPRAVHTVPRSRRLLVAAAAVATFLVGGGALAALLDSGGSAPTAAPSPAHTPVDEQSGASGTESQMQPRVDTGAPSAAAADAGNPVDLGALGDLSDPSVVAGLRGTAVPSARADRAAAPDRLPRLLARLDRNTCAPLGPPVALATGRLDGRSALVVVTRDSEGQRVVDAVLSGPCEVRRL
jgi:hypothetical protein